MSQAEGEPAEVPMSGEEQLGRVMVAQACWRRSSNARRSACQGWPPCVRAIRASTACAGGRARLPAGSTSGSRMRQSVPTSRSSPAPAPTSSNWGGGCSARSVRR